MNDLTCPSCDWIDADAARGDVAQCPRCGTSLRDSDDLHETVPNSAQDETLVAQLREAFGSGSRGLGARSRRFAGSSGKHGAAPSGSTEGLSPGSRFADFEIISEIGRGGMGVVYRARQISLDRPIALKVMTGARRLGPIAAERFHREARAAARLNHVNVVPVYAQGAEHDTHYYAMKLVEGVSLVTAIQSRPELLSSTHHLTASSKRAVERLGPLPAPTPTHPLPSIPASPPGDAAPVADAPVRRSLLDYRYMASLLAGAADGLAHAHQAGVVHRDIKPHNLILGDDWQLHLTDFGLAYISQEPHLTLSGEVMGTPAYLSPEQIRGNPGEIDHRTDIYSLGVTLYEMITTHRPFEFESRDQVLHAITTVEPRRPRQWAPAIPRDLETICLRAIEKEPSRRYPTADDFATDLRRFAEGRPILSRRAGPVERSFKWARRHRSLTAAMIAVAAVFFASAGWSMSVAAANRRESDQLLRDAYEHLVYNDIQDIDRVEESVRRAEAQNGDALQLQLVRALMDLGRSNYPAAVEKLHRLTVAVPSQIDWHYLLAWALWGDRQRDQTLQGIRDADAAGGPQTPDGWFFRALAIHHYDPAQAVGSYRKATSLGAATGLFFPQADFHLARAHNQRMYNLRTADGFGESEPALLQLVDKGYYGVRPHYLLSLAHRLVGEVLANSTGTRPDNAAHHLQQARFWAEKGMEKDPANDRPVTALAEYFEFKGEWEEALSARTQAIELATTQLAKCEGFHYRWRLHYWLGHHDAALADITERNICIQNSKNPENSLIKPYYLHVYPALIFADRGDLAAAQREARAVYDDDPSGLNAVLLSVSLLRAFGDPATAQEIMPASENLAWDNPAGDVNAVPGWNRSLFEYVAGRAPFGSVIALAEQAPAPYRLMAEAEFYAGLAALSLGDRPTALAHFSNSRQSFDSEGSFSYHARILQQKMQADPGWPLW